MQENQVIGIQKTPNTNKESKNYYNKLEKVSKRDKKKEKKLTKKLSPDEGVTKRIRGEDHLPSVSKLIRLPSKRSTSKPRTNRSRCPQGNTHASKVAAIHKDWNLRKTLV